MPFCRIDQLLCSIRWINVHPINHERGQRPGCQFAQLEIHMSKTPVQLLDLHIQPLDFTACRTSVDTLNLRRNLGNGILKALLRIFISGQKRDHQRPDPLRNLFLNDRQCRLFH